MKTARTTGTTRKIVPAAGRGFSLFELLLSMTITIVLVGLMSLAISSVGTTFNRSTGHLEATSEARTALSLLRSDLESAVFRASEGEWLKATPEVVQRDAAWTATRAYWLTFFAPSEDRDAGDGDLCALSYRLVWQDPIASPTATATVPTFALYRAIAPARESWEDALGKPDVQTDFWSVRSGGDGRGTAELLALHVVDLSLALQRRPPASTVTERVALTDGLRVGDGEIQTAAGLVLFPWEQLESLELTLTVLSPEGARLVGAMPMDDLVRSHGYVFTEVLRPHFLGGELRE